MLNTIVNITDIIVAILITISVATVAGSSTIILVKEGKASLVQTINDSVAFKIFTWRNLVNWTISISMLYVFYVNDTYYAIYASAVGLVVNYGIVAWAYIEGKRLAV